MGRHLQDPATGRMRGSVGAGRDAIPTPQDNPPGRGVGPSDSPGAPPWVQAYERFQQPADDSRMPSITLFDAVAEDDYAMSLERGFLRVQRHPDYPYLIHNYTEACAWENAWNDATLTCRGLITHADTGQVLARPFRKFFNHDQAGAPVFEVDRPVVVMEKADGSLGISYPRPDGTLAIATRGSFTSEQAEWANRLYAARYADRFAAQPDLTYMFEIIAPFNRVVVDYGDQEDLILLGAVETSTGRSVPLERAAAGWPGPVIEVHGHTSLREVLEAPARDNAEGFVLWDPETDERIKYKYEDYKRLHRYLTSTTPKHVWEVLSAGEDPAVVFAAAPDEFHVWLKDVAADLNRRFAERDASVREQFAGVTGRLPDGWQRKDFAAAVSRSPDKSLLFLMLDGRPLDEMIWRDLRPTGPGSSVRTVSPAAD